MSEKKKHKGESIIGKIIYATLLFMPLMSIFVRCMYVVCNKNAYQSYSDEYVGSMQTVNDENMMQANNNYAFNPKTFYDNTPQYTNAGKIKYNSININWNDILGTNQQLTPQEEELVDGFVFYKANNNRLNLYNGETLIRQAIENGQQGNAFRNLENTIYFNYNSSATWNIGSYQLNFTSGATQIIMMKTEKLDNAFQFSIQQVEQNSMYNWTTSTGTYDVINRTTTGLGIQNSFVDLLLTYWILLTIIYIIYDIGLCLVMMAHRKVHSLIDSVD